MRQSTPQVGAGTETERVEGQIPWSRKGRRRQVETRADTAPRVNPPPIKLAENRYSVLDAPTIGQDTREGYPLYADRQHEYEAHTPPQARSPRRKVQAQVGQTGPSARTHQQRSAEAPASEHTRDKRWQGSREQSPRNTAGSGRAEIVSDQDQPRQCMATSDEQQSCLFVPGRLGGRALKYLIDTGSSKNLLSRAVFDRLPEHMRSRLDPLSSIATMADGSGLPMYGQIELDGRLRNTKFRATFLVCKITDEAILGMQFLREQNCTVSCDRGLLIVGSETIPCVDTLGRLLCNKVQVLRATTVSPNAEVQVCCRLSSEPSGPTGIIENHLSTDCGVVVAATLGRPSSQRRVLVRCLNVTSQPQELRAGMVIGLYQPV